MTYRLSKDLKPAIPLSCNRGHKFYVEAEAQRMCPFCLFSDLTTLQARIAQAPAPLSTWRSRC